VDLIEIPRDRFEVTRGEDDVDSTRWGSLGRHVEHCWRLGSQGWTSNESGEVRSLANAVSSTIHKCSTRHVLATTTVALSGKKSMA
jgi:hypothetical protein